MFYVYAYFYPNTKLPFYIGKGCGDRKNSHLYAARRLAHYNKFLQSEINKIIATGQSPEIEIIQRFTDENAAYDFEKVLIKQYGRRLYEDGGSLCNILIGGRGRKGYKHSSETKQKMRGRIVSDATKLNMKLAHTGKRLTEEQKFNRKKIEPWNHSAETIEKMKKPKSLTHRNNIQIAQSGKKCPRAKQWIIKCPNNLLHQVTSLKTFCEVHGLQQTAIYRSLERNTPVEKGKSKGWHAISKI